MLTPLTEGLGPRLLRLHRQCCGAVGVTIIVAFGGSLGLDRALALQTSWSDPVVVDIPSHRVTGVDVAAGPDRFAVVVWIRLADRRGPGAPEIRGRVVASVRGRHRFRFAEPLNLSGRGASSPRVGVSGNGQTVVTWIGRHHRARAVVRRPGFGWSEPHRLSNAPVLGAEKLAVGRDGLAIAGWLEGPANARRIVASVMEADGRFAPPVVLSADKELGSLPFFDVAAAADGHGAVAWNGDCPALTRVAFLEQGGAFRSPDSIPRSECAGAGIRVAVDDRGGAGALISGYLDASRVRASVRPPTGPFTVARKISDGVAVNGELGMAGDGRAVAIWGLFRQSGSPIGIAAAIRPSTGTDFGVQRRISDRHGGGLEALAINSRGEAVAIWQSLKSFRLRASVLPARGQFQQPERVSPRLSNKELAEPAVTINARGHAIAAWASSPQRHARRGVFVSFRRPP